MINTYKHINILQYFREVSLELNQSIQIVPGLYSPYCSYLLVLANEIEGQKEKVLPFSLRIYQLQA